MPTNILRKQSDRKYGSRPHGQSQPRVVVLEIGTSRIHILLAATPTADRIWAALPLFSTAETWGNSIHFELPVKSGRDRTARLNVRPGDVCFWSEDDRVLLGWGPTPISLPTEIRLMRPCNIWGRALEDVSLLEGVTPGERVSLKVGK
ncbi:MAG: cyclophilin-like family protein [Hyphomicrobiaceae bacterium]